MAPKKEAAPANNTIEGYDVKETRILAAAFVSSLGADKYDWPLFAKLTGFTEGSLKKYWPPVKNKAVEQTESFGTFLKGAGAAPALSKAAVGGKKRKAADAETDAELDPKASSADTTNGKAKKAPAKKRGKKAKTDEVEEEKVKQEEENSADGGDGLGEFVYKRNVADWLEGADGSADDV
ncbi:hypothetical protein E8E12_000280 [Didymella heteroderae]|uniref:DNA binding n=1 Tax=Didymella heteroderae TaxID=1769908 RepID=A0A9P4WGG3_9PLEO|nr:hypothetical protein E8E12_000280 [Didymella heteroderae]